MTLCLVSHITSLIGLFGSGMLYHLILTVEGQVMNKVSRMLLSFFMKYMSVSELEYGLGIVSSTITLLGNLIIVLVVRYKNLLNCPTVLKQLNVH